MDAIIRKAIVAKDINHKGQGLWVTMRKLLGDFAQVNYPSFSLQHTSAGWLVGHVVRTREDVAISANSP